MDKTLQKKALFLAPFLILLLVYLAYWGFNFTFAFLLALALLSPIAYFFPKLFPIRYLFILFTFSMVIFLLIFPWSKLSKKNSSNTKSPTSSITTTLSASECQANFTKFNGKVLKISGEGIQGHIYLHANVEKCRIEALHLFVMTSTFTEHKAYNLPYLYNFTGITMVKGDRKNYRSAGYVAPAYSNTTSLPTPGITSSEVSNFYKSKDSSDNLKPTQTFYSSFEIWEELSDKGFQHIFTYNQYGIIDAVPYMIEETLKEGGHSYTSDSQKAGEEGTIYKAFTFTITE